LIQGPPGAAGHPPPPPPRLEAGRLGAFPGAVQALPGEAYVTLIMPADGIAPYKSLRPDTILHRRPWKGASHQCPRVADKAAAAIRHPLTRRRARLSLSRYERVSYTILFRIPGQRMFDAGAYSRRGAGREEKCDSEECEYLGLISQLDVGADTKATADV